MTNNNITPPCPDCRHPSACHLHGCYAADPVTMDGLVGLLEALAGDCENTDGWEEGAPTIRQAIATIERQREALDIARKQVVELACVGTEKLRDLGCECDPPERTYTPILDRIDKALESQP